MNHILASPLCLLHLLWLEQGWLVDNSGGLL